MWEANLAPPAKLRQSPKSHFTSVLRCRIVKLFFRDRFYASESRMSASIFFFKKLCQPQQTVAELVRWTLGHSLPIRDGCPTVPLSFFISSIDSISLKLFSDGIQGAATNIPVNVRVRSERICGHRCNHNGCPGGVRIVQFVPA